jgi:hypothetical protein
MLLTFVSVYAVWVVAMAIVFLLNLRVDPDPSAGTMTLVLVGDPQFAPVVMPILWSLVPALAALLFMGVVAVYVTQRRCAHWDMRLQS